jgi:LuxR family maltose regulon positive regulatory protein
MVAADAGCGKTTLIADFIRNQTRPTVWYQLDHTDADPIVFLGYVAQGIRNICPGFGEAIFQYLAEAGEEVLRYPERAADLLTNQILGSVEQPIILVLDDYHHIGRDTVVHKLVDRVIQYSSDLLHLIITTRDLPPLAIMRRRSQSAAVLITREDLLFTDDEVRQLFKQTLDLDLRDDEITEYRSRTHGWITALQLVRQVAVQSIHLGNERLDLSEVLKQSEKDIFDYFAEEVLSREDEKTQKLLLYLSLLESMPLDLCSTLFPDMHCSAELPALSQKNIFLTSVGDGRSVEEYRFHPLFRGFLQRRLRSEIGQAGVAAERNRIAEHFLANRQWEMALPHLVESGNFSAAAEVIAESGSEWISAGALTSLEHYAGKVPNEFLEMFPRSLLHKAEVARIRGEGDASSKLLHRAAALLKETGDAVGEAEALHSLASIARRRGKLTEAFKLLERAEKLVPSDSETYLKCVNTRGLCLVAERQWVEAEQQFRIALELAERLGNERYVRLVTHNLALPPGFRGDFGEALRWFSRILRDDQPDKQLPQEAIGHLNMSRLHLYRGELDETEKHLVRALELCQLYNLNFLRGEIFEAYANFYREKGDMPHAEEYYERAANAYNEARVDISARELNEERAKLSLSQGNFRKARVLLEDLIEARKAAGNELGIRTARVCLARVDLAEGRTETLVDELRETIDFFHTQNNYYDEALASMLLAETHMKLGNNKEMIAPVSRVLDLSARFDYDYWLRGEIRRLHGLFSDEDIIDKLPPDLRTELSASGEQPPAIPGSAREITAPVTDLTIKLLGPVEIHRDRASPFAPDAWSTRRARDIFCYIASSKHRRVAKDLLIEVFWGDEDPASVEKNFHPTISHIRKALNSRQTLKQNFIVFRDGAYQLNPELSYSIDSELFERHIADAESAKREKNSEAFRSGLEAAHALYRGEFMPGTYDDWAEERRNYYSEQFQRVLTALAKLSFSEKKWSQALKFANEILSADPYREDVQRLVMKALAAQGKPAAVKDQFETLKKLLKSELGIEPAPETSRVFLDLMQ